MNDLFVAPAPLQTLKFFVPIEPRGKGRPRTRVVAASGGKPFATVYTDAKTKKYEAELSRFATDAKVRNGWKLKPEWNLRVEVTATFLIPKSYSKRDKAALDNRPAANRIDADNLIKAALDACNNILFIDDKCVVAVECSKFWTVDFDKQGLSITVIECA